MKNVLIPTDFTPASLDLIANVAQALPGKISIILFHALEMPDNLIDAIRRAGLKDHNQLISEALRIKCKKLKSMYSNINNISFKIMHGSTPAVFENYAEANDIDLIVYPEGYTFIPVVRESVNPERMFKKSGIELMRRFTPKKVVKEDVAQPVAIRKKEREMQPAAVLQHTYN